MGRYFKMEQLNTQQIKEAKYLYDNESLRELSFEEPDAIIFWDDGRQSLITEKADDFINAYETALDFFIKKLSIDYKENLNEFAKSLGYGLGKTAFSIGDFLKDWNEYSELDLRDLIKDCFDGEELGDVYDG